MESFLNFLAFSRYLNLTMPRYFLTCIQNSSLHVELFADGSEMYAVGRGYENNLILVKNKLISRRHCQLFKESNGSVRIMADSDVNGIVINARLLILSGESTILADGDDIYIVHSRKKPEKNLVLRFTVEKTAEDQQNIQSNETGAFGVDIPASGNVNINVLLSNNLDTNMECNQNDVTGDVTEVSEKNEESQQKADTASNVSCATKTALQPEVRLSSSLQCSICLSILYDPVTLSPCMHSFCSGCCSGWLATSRRCPVCRNKISLLSKNPSLRAIIDAYVAANPDSAKPEKEKTMLDTANRLHFDKPFISGSCLPLNERGAHLARLSNGAGDGQNNGGASAVVDNDNEDAMMDSDNDSDSDDEWTTDDSSDSDDSDDETEETTGWPVGSDTEIEESDIPERHEFEHNSSSNEPICRQCLPENSENSYFRCSDPLRHVLCNCCENPMPDRRTDRSAPFQTCWICSLEYCNLYWSNSCQNGNCAPTCLKQLKEINLVPLLEDDLANITSPESSSSVLLFGNVHETSELKKHLKELSFSAEQFRDELLQGLETEKYSTNSRTLVGAVPDRFTPICHYCRLNIVQDLVFDYRLKTKDASTDKRPNCPHGRYCVSQSQDHSHAIAVNHICEPTPPGIMFDASEFAKITVEKKSNQSSLPNGHLDLD